MNALLRKEIRQLGPAWAAACVLTAIPGILCLGPGSVAVCCGFAVLYCSVAVFGKEFSANTFGLMLTQPVDRRAIWKAKVWVASAGAVVILAMGLAAALYSMWEWDSEFGGWANNSEKSLRDAVIMMPILALLALSGGLWTTLVFRQAAAAFWIAIIAPYGLIFPILVAMDYFHVPELAMETTAVVLLVVYSVYGFWLARRLFLRAQDVAPQSRAVNLAFNSALVSRLLTWLPHRPIPALIRKEIQLQQSCFVIAAMLFVMHLAAILACYFIKPDKNSYWDVIFEMIWVIWFIIPVVLGANAVADERRMNTMETHLCLPVSNAKKFAVKFGVVMLLSVLLGAVAPTLLESLRMPLHLQGEMLEGVRMSWKSLYALSLVASVLAFICFYASTMTRGILQAVGAAIIIGTGYILYEVYVPNNLWLSMMANPRGDIIVGGRLALLVVVFWLAYRNARTAREDRRLFLFNGGVMLGAAAVATGALFVYSAVAPYQLWQLFLPTEAKHGPAALRGDVRPKLCAGGSINAVALLPDGRLWKATKYAAHFREFDTVTKQGHTNFVDLGWAVPIEGTFLPGSNWVDLALSSEGTVVLRSDGTVWRIEQDLIEFRKFARPLYISNAVPSVKTGYVFDAGCKFEQIGTNADWVGVTAGRAYYILVKKDGTLWGHGENSEGCLLNVRYIATNGLFQLGTNADWAGVFADDLGGVTGVKRDGTVWGWGDIWNGPNAKRLRSYYNTGGSESIQCKFIVGTNWAELRYGGVVLGKDGSLWNSEEYLTNVKGVQSEDLKRYPERRDGLVRIDAPGQWSEIPTSQFGLRRGGKLTLYFFGGYDMRIRSFWARYTSPNADWLAVSKSTDIREAFGAMALAADGTMAQWTMHYSKGLFRFSRKPEWTCNILQISRK